MCPAQFCGESGRQLSNSTALVILSMMFSTVHDWSYNQTGAPCTPLASCLCVSACYVLQSDFPIISPHSQISTTLMSYPTTHTTRKIMIPTLCECLCSVMLPKAMLMSIDHAAPKGHIDVSNLQCQLGPGWCPWS